MGCRDAAGVGREPINSLDKRPGGRLFYLHLACDARPQNAGFPMREPARSEASIPRQQDFLERRVAMADEPNATAANSGLSDDAASGLAYLTIIPAIVFLIVEPYNKNSYVQVPRLAEHLLRLSDRAWNALASFES